jgi:hypothetical protein
MNDLLCTLYGYIFLKDVPEASLMGKAEMRKKREKFRLEEKNQRLDVRMTTSLRDRLENYCKPNSMRLTEAITKALEEYLEKNERKSQENAD